MLGGEHDVVINACGVALEPLLINLTTLKHSSMGSWVVLTTAGSLGTDALDPASLCVAYRRAAVAGVVPS